MRVQQENLFNALKFIDNIICSPILQQSFHLLLQLKQSELIMNCVFVAQKTYYTMNQLSYPVEFLLPLQLDYREIVIPDLPQQRDQSLLAEESLVISFYVGPHRMTWFKWLKSDFDVYNGQSAHNYSLRSLPHATYTAYQ